MHHNSFCTLLTVTALWASACGSDDASTQPDAASPDAQTACVPVPDTSAANGELDGTWAVLTRTYADVQGLGGRQIARNVYVHEYSDNGGTFEVVETLCSLEVDSEDGGSKVRLNRAFIESLPRPTLAGTLAAGDAGGYDYTLERHYAVRGVELTDPIGEELPMDAADPRVIDQDGDGNPGITLLLDGFVSGQLFVVQRDFSASSGSQVSGDRVEGLVEWGSETVYLGADPEFLLTVVGQAMPAADPGLHTFQQVRIPAGSDCTFVLENRCSLFVDAQ